MVIAIGSNGDRHWCQWRWGAPLAPLRPSSLEPLDRHWHHFFVAIGANGENPKSLCYFCQVRARVKVRVGVRVRVGSRVDPDHNHNRNPNQLKLKNFFGELFASSPREFARTRANSACIRQCSLRHSSRTVGESRRNLREFGANDCLLIILPDFISCKAVR